MTDTAGERAKTKPARDAQGRWLPGQSANPSGRPTNPEWFDERLSALSPEMLTLVEGIARNGKSEAVRFEAARYLIDRKHGKPVELTKILGDRGPVAVVLPAPSVVEIRAVLVLAGERLGFPREQLDLLLQALVPSEAVPALSEGSTEGVSD